MSSGLDSELESFRQQWLSDLRKKDHHATASSSRTATSPQHRKRRPSSPTKTRRPAPTADDDDGDYVPTLSFDEPPQTGHTLDGSVKSPAEKKLVSALDHYEEAMEREAQGNMGDSLKLYRQAYRLDNRIDKTYREKHFPKQPAPSVAPPPEEAAPPPEPVILPIGELIDSFSSLSIEPAPPLVEGSPPPPCPIVNVPDELLTHILCDVARSDVGELTCAALACKRLAYLVAREQRIWRHVALFSPFGFPGMHYTWNKTIEWDDLDEPIPFNRAAESVALTKSLVPDPYDTWKAMFRARPRIRFNGCYICTVNYVRTGQASTNQATWGGSPIHIVTYYRYLRFFRDGTVISLLATEEPRDVVHHLTKDMVHLHQNSTAHAYLPSAPMTRAHKGRWMLVPADDDGDESDLVVETQGVGPKYMYRLELSLRSAGKGARNNKLIWRRFTNYNRLTDDWGTFHRKHDKPFYFSRVKSYGIGE